MLILIISVSANSNQLWSFLCGDQYSSTAIVLGSVFLHRCLLITTFSSFVPQLLIRWPWCLCVLTAVSSPASLSADRQGPQPPLEPRVAGRGDGPQLGPVLLLPGREGPPPLKARPESVYSGGFCSNMVSFLGSGSQLYLPFAATCATYWWVRSKT